MSKGIRIEGVLRQMPREGLSVELTPGDPVWTVDEIFDGYLNKRIRVTVEVLDDDYGHHSDKR